MSGYDSRLSYDFTNGLCGGNSFSSMSGLSGLGGVGGGLDIQSMIMSLLNGLPSYTSTASSTQTTQLTPKQLEEAKKAEEKADEKVEAAKEEVKKEETKLTEKETAKKDITDKEYTTGDALTSVGKGVAGFLTNMVTTKDAKGESHFSLGKALTTGVIAGGAIAASFLFPPVGVALAVGGAVLSGVQVVKGVSDLSNAKTHADKDAAVQELTEGTVGGVLSVVGFKGAGALKGAKAAKTAESLTCATDGLEIAALDATEVGRIKSTGVLGELLHNNPALEETVVKNPNLMIELTTAIRKGHKANLGELQAELTKAGIHDNKQISSILDAVQAGNNTQDAELISSITREIELIRNSKGNTNIIKNATETLSNLLKQTSKEGGISPEVEAELVRIQKESPEIGKLLGLSKAKSSIDTKVMSDLAGRENAILRGLKGVDTTAEADKTIIKEAITLLENLNKNGANREELVATFQKLLKSGYIKGILRTNLESAQRALKLTTGDVAKSIGRGAVEGVFSAPGMLYRGTKAVVTHPFTEPGDTALQAGRAGIFFPQAFHQADESIRERLQEAILAELDKTIKTQKDAVAEATNKERKAVEALAKLHKVDLQDDRHELKSVAKLKEEIAEARNTEKEAKEALAAAEKEKAEKAAA